MSAPADMLKAAEAALPHAYARYSDFPVAAVFRSESGKLYAGVNVENASYSMTLCAEASALGALVSDGQKKITEALILVPKTKLCPPCGPCRQRLYEFASEETVVHLCAQDNAYRALTVGELLPFAFGSAHLA